MQRRTLPRTLTAMAAVALALSACGGSDSGGGTEATDVTVGVIPIVDVAPLYLGIQKGFFSQRGLNVKPTPAQGGAAIVPAVLSGQTTFGFSNVVSLLTAREKGLPLLSVAAGASSTGDPNADVNAVLVGKSSTLRSAKDLAGKRVAINSLNNIGDTTIKAAVEKDGGDPSQIKFVELPFPDMPAQLEKGTVDAVWNSEPWRTQIISSGGRALFDNLTAVHPKLQIAQYFTSENFKGENEQVVTDFVAGLNESFAYATEHPDEVRAILSTYTELTPEVAAKIVLPDWPTELDKDSTSVVGQAAQKYGTLKKAPDVDGLLGSGT